MNSLKYLQLKEKKDKYTINLLDFMGKGVQITESKKSLDKKNKDFFISLLSALLELDARTEELLDLGINLIKYEDPHHQIIVTLIFLLPYP